MYDFVVQCFDELFEVDCISSGGVSNFLNNSEDEWILDIKAKNLSGHEDISDIDLSLPGVSVEGEELMELVEMVLTEEWVFSANVLGHDLIEVFLECLSSCHRNILF